MTDITHIVSHVQPRKMVGKALLWAVIAFLIYEIPIWVWFVAAAITCALTGSETGIVSP